MKYICLLLFCLPTFVFSQDNNLCTDSGVFYPEQILKNVSQQCEALASKPQKRIFLRRQLSRFRSIRNLVSKASYKSLRNGIKKLRKKSCKAGLFEASTCSEKKSTEMLEFLNNVELKSCDLEFKKDRRRRLKKTGRVLTRLEANLGSDFVASVAAHIKFLMNSEECGKGGSSLLNHCKSINETADGIGKNVYKLLHYAPYLPLFVTRDDAKVCHARRSSGSLIETLGYSGLNNPDEAGLRHHYRFSLTCEQLPKLFYIECNGRCYEIDDRCGRID